jgi:excinuclease ABC subunit C
VVFNTNGPIKSDYRRYNIKGITGGDDYAAMQQALMRRYSKLKEGEGKIPDLLLIDGGKGQLRQAIEVIDELQLPGVTLVGVAKGKGRKAGLERLFLRGRRQPIILGDASSALHLVQQVRDEAHRFAITGHRQRRGKARTQSTLQEIEGIGEKRRQSLLKHFGGMQGVKGAGVRDLASVPGISMSTAERIYSYFREEP